MARFSSSKEKNVRPRSGAVPAVGMVPHYLRGVEQSGNRRRVVRELKNVLKMTAHDSDFKVGASHV